MKCIFNGYSNHLLSYTLKKLNLAFKNKENKANTYLTFKMFATEPYSRFVTTPNRVRRLMKSDLH